MVHCCYPSALQSLNWYIPFYLEGISYSTSLESNLKLLLERLQKKSQAQLLVFKLKYYKFTEVECLNSFLKFV